jgi:hypothetical protein
MKASDESMPIDDPAVSLCEVGEIHQRIINYGTHYIGIPQKKSLSKITKIEAPRPVPVER